MFDLERLIGLVGHVEGSGVVTTKSQKEVPGRLHEKAQNLVLCVSSRTMLLGSTEVRTLCRS